MAKVKYVLVEQEYAEGRKAMYVVKADSLYISGVILKEVSKTKEKKVSEQNGRPVNKFVSEDGSVYWVYSDCSVMR